MTERVLVTGGSNGLGRAMVDRLLADGCRVVNLDLQPAAAPHVNEVFVQADVTDERGLRAALAAA